MRKKLSLYVAILGLLAGTFSFSGCTDEHYYNYEDPSATWEILQFTVDTSPSTKNPKWGWNSAYNRYECMIDISSDVKLDEFIYNDGIILAYIFRGTMGVNETQYLLSDYYYPEENAYVNYYTSFNGNTLRLYFYFERADAPYTDLPPSCNFRVVLLY